MKKVLALLLIAIIGLFAFVACNPDSSLNEELVNVTITSRDTRSLSAEASFKLANVTTWKYTAEKADNGLKTGATATEVELKDGKTEQLSQGSWNFKLFGYKGENLICVGEAPNTTITVENHTITILVGPQQTETGRGKIFIDSNISIADKDGKLFTDTKNVYTKIVTVKDSSENKVEESGFYSVKSGMYSVTVEYKAKDKDNNEYVAASAKKYFNVYDNLTTTISGTVEETTQSGEAKPEAEKVVASVDGVYFDSITKAIEASSKDKPLVLLKDATLNENVILTENASIDLKGYTLTANHLILGKSTNPYEVKIENGTINGNVSEGNLFDINTNAKLILNGVTIDYTTKPTSENPGAGIFLYDGANPASLEVKNSTINVDGSYGIGANASEGISTKLNISIENSTVTTTTSSYEDNTAILFNVPGELKISNSTISGQRQGVIVRGGTATISNSTIISSGTRTDYTDYTKKGSWGSGNEVPLAALVVGNRGSETGYPYSKTAVLDNVTLSTPNENTVRKSIYVYQNEIKDKNKDEIVVVAGNINGNYIINEETNGANVSIGDVKAEIINEDKTTKELFNSSSSISQKNISVIIDGEKNTLTLDNDNFNEGTNSKNVTLIGKLDSEGKPVSTVDVITNAVTAEGGELNYQRGSSFSFENLTIQAGEGDFDGIVCDELVYKNCTIKGKLTLYGKATFINCTFENEMGDQYSIWTWGGTDVKFENCTFNTNGKAILLYGQATESKPTNLVVNNCVFNDRNNGTAGKAAIEIGNDYNATYTLTVTNATVNGFAKGKNTDSKLWANKNSMDAEHLTVTIDGTKIQ